MNRRNVLIALGAVAIMTGIVFGTGAFTQVEAERTVTVDFADDSNAFLKLNETAQNPEYVTTTTGAGGQQIVQIDLSATSGAQGDGLNDNAVTTIDPVLNVTNQGTQAVNVTFDGAQTTPGVALTGTGGALNNLNVGQTEQVGIEVAVGNAPRTVNGGNITDDTQDLTLVIEADATTTP